MNHSYNSLENLKYVLFEIHQAAQLFEQEKFKDHDVESASLFLDSIQSFSDAELFPAFRAMDEQPAHYKDGEIILHPKFGEWIEPMAELGLVGSNFSYEHGGMQLPETIFNAGYFILEAANNHASGIPGLATGAADLIATFGSEELIETYVPNMLSGKWCGTMCLTEPQAGSSLSDLTSTATPTEAGHYQIKGQKIFISGGDHTYSENFVHLTLARIEGAPAGTKGISLFVVPKNRITADGQLIPNDVVTLGDFQKLGQRGYCTTHLGFGADDNCHGYLVGEPNQGLKYMFQMMNGARIAVGRGAVAIATAAYYASLQYATERPQGRRISNSGAKDLAADQTLIINHADVRRMLFLQKSIAEGTLSLLVQATMYYDLSHDAAPEDAEKYRLLLELLTPIVKTYPSEAGQVSVSNGLQVLGGYGFCSEYILQQYYRDIRIFSIYEGTTGIQSLDLLGRKVPMKGGKAVRLLAAEIQQTIESAMTYQELAPYAKTLGEKLILAQKILEFLMPFAMKGQHERYLSDATLFMEYMGILATAWQWLKMGIHAKQALLSGDKTHLPEFYESKLHTMKFYFKYEVPKTSGLSESIMDPEVLTLAGEKELIR